jgi:hypothetical protein
MSEVVKPSMNLNEIEHYIWKMSPSGAKLQRNGNNIAEVLIINRLWTWISWVEPHYGAVCIDSYPTIVKAMDACEDAMIYGNVCAMGPNKSRDFKPPVSTPVELVP